jgi:hypothetical protein
MRKIQKTRINEELRDSNAIIPNFVVIGAARSASLSHGIDVQEFAKLAVLSLQTGNAQVSGMPSNFGTVTAIE